MCLRYSFIHFGLGFKHNSTHDWKNHAYWKIIAETYDVKPKKLYNDDHISVGEPLILTPLIKNKLLSQAREAARVDDKYLIPGVESYAGYLTVNEKHNGNLWFWYFPVKTQNIEEAPLILWLQGGPGASSLYGLFEEIGPFTVTDDLTLREHPYSWGKNNSLLFIDNPVGTGFSFTDPAGYATNQTTIGENLYTALQQFLTLFPELRHAPLFIAGESYAGKHIPSLGIQIHKHRHDDYREPINLQGLAIGNGFIDPISLLKYSYFARQVGLVDDRTANEIKHYENATAMYINNGEAIKAFLNLDNILRLIHQSSSLPNVYNYLSEVPFTFNFVDFIEEPKIRRALHVGKTSFGPLSAVYEHLIDDFFNSVKSWLEQLVPYYRILVYSGHLDCMVPYHASVTTYMSLKYRGAKKYKKSQRHAWHHNGALAGYYKTTGNFLEVMVLGAGHMVPSDKPSQALDLITSFVLNRSLSHPDRNQ